MQNDGSYYYPSCCLYRLFSGRQARLMWARTFAPLWRLKREHSSRTCASFSLLDQNRCLACPYVFGRFWALSCQVWVAFEPWWVSKKQLGFRTLTHCQGLYAAITKLVENCLGPHAGERENLTCTSLRKFLVMCMILRVYTWGGKHEDVTCRVVTRSVFSVTNAKLGNKQRFPPFFSTGNCIFLITHACASATQLLCHPALPVDFAHSARRSE